jgi:hypothetical protein
VRLDSYQIERAVGLHHTAASWTVRLAGVSFARRAPFARPIVHKKLDPVRRLALREAARMPELFALIYVHGATCAELLAVAEGARNP